MNDERMPLDAFKGRKRNMEERIVLEPERRRITGIGRSTWWALEKVRGLRDVALCE